MRASSRRSARFATAERGKLSQPAVLTAQARRLHADPRARQSLVPNFAAQWLHLRNLDGITRDGRLFPDFDDNLRQSMRREIGRAEHPTAP